MSLAPRSATFSRFASLVGISKSGEKKTLSFTEDDTVFSVLTEAGLMTKDGTCQGNMSCGKCRVKVVSGKVPAPEDEEKDLLEDAPAGTRIACAIACDDAIEGATFQVV